MARSTDSEAHGRRWRTTRRVLLVLVVLTILTGFVLEFKFYILPWGEAQIKYALGLPANATLDASVVLANSCSGCILGSNTDWPTNTTGVLHFLDTSAGTMTSTITAISLGATGAVAVAGALLSDSAASLSTGFFEMLTIVEHGQFLTIISQLQIDGAPEFLYQFSKQFAWTNFNVPSSFSDAFEVVKAKIRESATPQVSSSSSSSSSAFSFGDSDDADSDDATATNSTGASGPARYASMLGVTTEELFFYTLTIFAMVIVAIHLVFLVMLLIVGLTCRRGNARQTASDWYNKVVGLCVLVLLMAQYIFAMAGSYLVFSTENKASARYTFGVLLLLLVVGIAILLGVIVVRRNRDELRDLGTYEHSQRAFSSKYGAYYKEYNFENRFFFVARILLAVTTGAVVGAVGDPTAQLTCILVLTAVYLALLTVREPQLLRVMYYVSLAAVLMKLLLVCLMLLLIHDNYLPQYIRENVAYGIIAVNMVIYLLLFVRQLFSMLHKVVLKWRRNRDPAGEDELETGTGRSGAYSRMDELSSRRR